MLTHARLAALALAALVAPIGILQAQETTTDAGLADVTVAIHTGEIRAARLALERARRPEVREYARTLISDHSAAIARLILLGIEPVESPAGLALRAQGEIVYRTLEATPDAWFDEAYLVSQVAMHLQAWLLLEYAVRPLARTPMFRAHVDELVPVVRRHLAEATGPSADPEPSPDGTRIP